MTHQNTPAFTRRDLLSMIGTGSGRRRHVPGDDIAGLRRRIKLQRPTQAGWREEGQQRADSRRRPGRHGRGARTAQCRLQGHDPGIQPARRWTLLVDTRWRHLHRAGRRRAALPLRQGRVLQRRSLAHPLPPPCRASLLPAAWRRTRTLRAGQLQRLGPLEHGLWRQAAALPPCAGRFPGSCRRTAGQGHAPGQPRFRA